VKQAEAQPATAAGAELPAQKAANAPKALLSELGEGKAAAATAAAGPAGGKGPLTKKQRKKEKAAQKEAKRQEKQRLHQQQLQVVLSCSSSDT
jgi:hypothetical protein